MSRMAFACFSLLLSASFFTNIVNAQSDLWDSQVFQRLRVAASFGGDAVGIIELIPQNNGQFTGTYTFPGEKKFANQVQYTRWELKDVRVVRDNNMSISYRIPADLLGNNQTVVVNFTGPDKGKGTVHLKSTDGELTCVDTGQRIICIADMNARFEKVQLNFQNILAHLQTKYGEQLDFTTSRVIIPAVHYEHNVVQNGQEGVIIHIEGWLVGMGGRKLKGVAYFYNANGQPLSDSDGQYTSTIGQVAVMSDDVFVRPDAYIKNHCFHGFIPYKQLEVPLETVDQLQVIGKIFDVSGSNPILLGASSDGADKAPAARAPAEAPAAPAPAEANIFDESVPAAPAPPAAGE